MEFGRVLKFSLYSSGKQTRNIVLYALPVIFFALVQIAAVPLVVSHYGLDVFGSISVGQAAGALILVFADLGFSVVGPARGASVRLFQLKNYYFHSLKVRLLIQPIALAAGLFIPFIFATPSPWLAGMASFPIILLSLSSTWLFTGLQKPGTNILVDTLPRALFSAFGLYLLWTAAPIWMYFAAQSAGIFGGVISTLLLMKFSDKSTSLGGRDLQVPLEDVRKLTTQIGSAQIIGTVFTSLPLIVAPLFLGLHQLAFFAFFDKLIRWGMLLLWPVMQWGNGLIVKASHFEKNVIVHRFVYFGLLVLLSSPFAALWGSEILTRGEINFGPTELVAVGLILGMWVLGTLGGFVLINMHRRKEILLGNIYGAGFFLCFFWPATNFWGYFGAVWVLVMCFSVANLTFFIKGKNLLRS